MSKLFNRARMTVASTGTGTLTLGSAASGGFLTFAQSGVANGDIVSYVIEDTGGAFEYGTGAYTSSGTTLSRTVIKSSNSNTAISVTSSAIVYLTALAADILNPANNLSDLQSTSTAKSNLSLNNVENTALSTWAGSSNITTLGTVGTGTWNGTSIAVSYGGTGATTASGARTNLGLVIGTDVQAFDGDLDAIAGISGTSGLLKKTAANNWSLDTSTYLTAAVTSVSFTGDGTVLSSTASTSSSGSVSASLISQLPNKILAGPSSGSTAAAPTYRSLVAADIPTLSYQSTITATGLLKGAGSGSISAATAGTDYLAPPSGTAILKAGSGGALANATAGTDYVAPGGSAGAITATGLKETKTAPTISTNTLTLDCSTGNVFNVSLNANVTTLSFSNVPTSGNAYGLTLSLSITGSFTVTWPASVKWPSGTAPTLTTTSGKTDTFVLFTYDGGTTWWAFTAGQNA